MLRALLELSRVSNLPTVWTNVLAAWIIASGADWQWTPALGWLLLGASLIYSAGMILNDACDVAWDREHRPERPIPSGRIGLKTVWFISLAGLAIGYALMVFGGGASWKITALLVAAVVAYDIYHKPWAGSVIIMGACRTLLYLSVINPAFTDRAAREKNFFEGDSVFSLVWVTLAGALLGVYIVALTLLARAEAKSNVSALERFAFTVLLFYPIITQGFREVIRHLTIDSVESVVWMFLFCFYVAWVIRAIMQMAKGGPAIGQAVGMLLAGIPLVDAVGVARVSWPTALCFCALPPFLRLWQRWIAAT